MFSISSCLNVKALLFQTIKFSISTHFTSFWAIDRNLSGATTLGQSGPGNDDNTGTLHSPKLQHYYSHTIKLSSVIYGITFKGVRPLWCTLQPLATGPLKTPVCSPIIIRLNKERLDSWHSQPEKGNPDSFIQDLIASVHLVRR